MYVLLFLQEELLESDPKEPEEVMEQDEQQAVPLPQVDAFCLGSQSATIGLGSPSATTGLGPRQRQQQQTSDRHTWWAPAQPP